MTVKSYLLAGCLATAISAGIADSNENEPIHPVLRKGICSEIFNEYECAQAIEKVQLQGSPQARRTDKGLCFDLPKDSEMCIADEKESYALFAPAKDRGHSHILQRLPVKCEVESGISHWIPVGVGASVVAKLLSRSY